MRGQNEKETERERESKKRMWLSLYLLSPSKPEVQAQVRVCRSFLCRLNLLLPIFCSAAFIFLSPSFAFFPTPSLPSCVSLNILYPPFSLSPISFIPRSRFLASILQPFEVKVQQYVDLILDWKHQGVVRSIARGLHNRWGKCHGPLSMTKAVSQSSLWIPASTDG